MLDARDSRRRPVTCPARAAAQSSRSTPTAGTAWRGGVPEVLFAAAAGCGGLAEPNISQIGVQRATDPQLKQFSQRDDR